MKKDFSPEERLLRLIKGSKKKELSGNNAPQENIESLQEKPRVKAVTAHSISLPFKLSGLNTRVLNYVLMTALTGLLLYFAYDIFYPSYNDGRPDIFAVSENIPKTEEVEGIIETPPFSEYSSVVSGRNIFKPQQTEVKNIVTGPSVEEISAGLSLIGIIAGNRRQAIIEDKKSGKSYFLYKGGSVGKSNVVDILEDSVIMEYQGQRFELVL